MARIVIVFEDDAETGKVITKQEWTPAIDEGEPLTPAQIRAFRAIGVEAENPDDDTDVWESMDGPELGGPI